MSQILHVTIPQNPDIDSLRQAIVTALNKLVDQINAATQSSNLDLGFNRAINSAPPASPTDLATKKYVDDLVRKST